MDTRQIIKRSCEELNWNNKKEFTLLLGLEQAPKVKNIEEAYDHKQQKSTKETKFLKLKRNPNFQPK